MGTIVAGASGGVGRSTARRLADGVNEEFVLTYHRRAAWAEDLTATLRDAGATATAVRTDVREPASVRDRFETADGTGASADAVVSTAGVVDPAPTEESAESSRGRVIETTLTGSFQVGKAAAPRLRATGGSLVGSSSVGGTAGTVDASYAASKAGRHGLVRALARELGSDGVRVNAVAPGHGDTAVSDTVRERSEATDYRGHEDIGTPLPAYACPPSEVAESVAGLLASGFTRGQALEVNGGMYL